MRALQRLRLPVVVLVNKIDRRGARPQAVVDAVARRLSPDVLPVQRVLDPGTPSARVEALPDDGVRTWLAGESRRGRAYPVLFGSAVTGAGIPELVTALGEFLPVASEGPDAPSGVVFAIDREDGGRAAARAARSDPRRGHVPHGARPLRPGAGGGGGVTDRRRWAVRRTTADVPAPGSRARLFEPGRPPAGRPAGARPADCRACRGRAARRGDEVCTRRAVPASRRGATSGPPAVRDGPSPVTTPSWYAADKGAGVRRLRPRPRPRPTLLVFEPDVSRLSSRSKPRNVGLEDDRPWSAPAGPERRPRICRGLQSLSRPGRGEEVCTRRVGGGCWVGGGQAGTVRPWRHHRTASSARSSRARRRAPSCTRTS